MFKVKFDSFREYVDFMVLINSILLMERVMKNVKAYDIDRFPQVLTFQLFE